MTLLLYSIVEKRWIRPHHVAGGQISDGMMMGDPSILVHGAAPPGRNGHSATLATDPDDEHENARIIIIGGWLGTGPLAASDTHILDISAGGRQLRWYQPAVKGTPPGPCNMHSADYVPNLRSVYVFRGGNGREYLNDLHSLNVDTLTWERVETTGAIPQQRANHSSAMLEETGELFVFGGWNGAERLNDIHILDTDTSNWTCPRVGGVLPHPRAGMTLTALRGRLYLFGGSGTSAKCFQDLQIFDRQEMAWLDVSPEASSGRSRGHNDIQYETDESIFRFGPFFDNNRDDERSDVNRDGPVQVGYGFGGLDGGTQDANRSSVSFNASHADWRARDMSVRPRLQASANPNDEDTFATVPLYGQGPGRRYVVSTAVLRRIFSFFSNFNESSYFFSGRATPQLLSVQMEQRYTYLAAQLDLIT
jgi:hypothetical protein